MLYGSMPTDQRESEPVQMLISMGLNGRIDMNS
jgi:hypothetical protein